MVCVWFFISFILGKGYIQTGWNGKEAIDLNGQSRPVSHNLKCVLRVRGHCV